MKKNKNKIEPGQCYEKDDKIYMIIGPWPRPWGRGWTTENTLTKELCFWKTDTILKMRRPFQNHD